MAAPGDAAEHLGSALDGIEGYSILERLGRGGMGVVYRVRDQATGEELALKTVRVATKETIAAIRREYRMLAGSRIPGVVRMRHEGVAQGLPYFLMECVVGRPLRACAGFDERAPARSEERVRSRPTPGGTSGEASAGPSDPPGSRAAGSSNLRDVLAVLARLCATLAELHGDGIVHADLKPENVIVRPNGQPVLVDFARASRFYGVQGRDRLELDLDALGTAAYMAPEQFSGQVVDARADLYALGCMLYELWTGRVPFTGSPGEMRAGHLHELPLAASAQNPELPHEVDRLITRLLEKDPARRPGHAGAVLEVLLRSCVLDAVEIPRANRAYLYRPALVGRSPELQRIEHACAGRGELLFIGGSSGIGKTRLLLELGARAANSGARVVSGECLPIAAAPDASAAARGAALHPFRAFLLAVADDCRLLGTAETERVLGTRSNLLSAVEPALAAVPGAAAAAAADPPAPEALARQLGDALASVLCAFAAGERLLVLLDDLQWADEVTLGWLRRVLGGELPLDRVSIVCTYRSEELTERHAWIAEASESQRITLLELGESEVEGMLSSMLALDACPSGLADLVSRVSGGNPLFIAEYLRLALEQGAVSRGQLGQWQLSTAPPECGPAGAASQIPATPESLQRILAQRIERLSSAARGVALGAACVGREGQLTLLEAVAGKELVEQVLDELLARDVLRLEPSGTFRFSHDKLRENVYESGTAEERRRLHGRAADAIEIHTRADVDPLAWILLAHHLECAEQHQRSFAHLERAADYFLATAAYADAIDTLSRAVRGMERLLERSKGSADRARLGRWERRLAVACLHLGRMDECERHALQALSLLRGGAPRSALAWGTQLVAHLAQQASHWVLPRRLYQRPRERDALVEVAQTAAALSRACFFSGDTLRMVTASLMAVNAAECADSRADTPRDFASLGYICSLFGARSLTRHYFLQARAARQCFDALLLEALYRLGQGQWTEAENALTEAEGLAADGADPQDVETVQTLLGHFEHYVGRLEAALERFGRVLASARRRKNRQSEAWALYCTARGLIALGFPEQGVEHCERALQALTEQPDLMTQVSALGVLLSGAAAAGQLTRAAEPARALEQLLDGARPTAFAMLHGWEGLATYELARWRRARTERQPSAELAAVRKAALAASARLSSFVRIFPLAEPWAWRTRGQALLLADRAGRAEDAFERSALAAAHLRMPFDEALAYAGLAEAIDPSSPERALVRKVHSERAAALFTKLGCVRGT